MKKYQFTLWFFVISANVFGQSMENLEQKLNNAFSKIRYWAYEENNRDFSQDSLSVANKKFEDLLFTSVSTNPETLKHDFKTLQNNGLYIATSEDGKFRIYSWDIEAGGSMHFFKNIYQYTSGNKIFAEKSKDIKNDAGVFYYQINDVVSDNKTYYVSQSIAVLSSALSFHRLSVFAITNDELDTNAKLIKTQTGIKNQLSYEVDLSAKTNSEREVKNYRIDYNPKTKTISIPLIQADFKVTNKRIQYQFKGKYFEKI